MKNNYEIKENEENPENFNLLDKCEYEDLLKIDKDDEEMEY